MITGKALDPNTPFEELAKTGTPEELFEHWLSLKTTIELLVTENTLFLGRFVADFIGNIDNEFYQYMLFQLTLSQCGYLVKNIMSSPEFRGFAERFKLFLLQDGVGKKTIEYQKKAGIIQ